MKNFRFAAPMKLPPGFINTRILRDNFKRQQSAEHEVLIRALKYIARNTTLPPRARLEAQLQLTSMPHYTRITSCKDRCFVSGTSRSVLKHFHINRIQFREMALGGLLPGVRKAAW
ncbi:mitochondrial 37S ribosomal protein uS14m [Ascoidea rubescens DSM 1968]|uniref:37S ribosomal protein MRP2, mitochondrial n=1 Tax=Ascoidea rubescens DSM 1968 TaxID=1344418 RepID=A0A1D2VFM3_9ASCO|nr:glucocorticoid receptor-like (DNA-binding domain) [Ascoidea rubescens DSM 1968]ODV60436.1 glucocorticoid receptor-like (DNA-binding domain) [Ascoidea rubescens DSM 1968]